MSHVLTRLQANRAIRRIFLDQYSSSGAGHRGKDSYKRARKRRDIRKLKEYFNQRGA